MFSFSFSFFTIYIDDVIRKKNFIFNFRIGNRDTDTLLFASDQAVLAFTEDNFQRPAYSLGNVSAEYNMEISAAKTNGIFKE